MQEKRPLPASLCLTTDQKVVCSNHAGCMCLIRKKLQCESLMDTGFSEEGILATSWPFSKIPLLAVRSNFTGLSFVPWLLGLCHAAHIEIEVCR